LAPVAPIATSEQNEWSAVGSLATQYSFQIPQ
jgi:hypothetical protein